MCFRETSAAVNKVKQQIKCRALPSHPHDRTFGGPGERAIEFRCHRELRVSVLLLLMMVEHAFLLFGFSKALFYISNIYGDAFHIEPIPKLTYQLLMIVVLNVRP